MKTVNTIVGSRVVLTILRITILITGLLIAYISGMAAIRSTEIKHPALQKAWVILYDAQGCQQNLQLIRGGEDIANLADVDFDNKCVSIRYKIPVGWAVVLYAGEDFRSSELVLSGTGRPEEITVPVHFAQRASSIRWERELD
jgi:hypothetical protein